MLQIQRYQPRYKSVTRFTALQLVVFTILVMIVPMVVRDYQEARTQLTEAKASYQQVKAQGGQSDEQLALY